MKTPKILETTTLFDSIERQSLRVDLVELCKLHRVSLIPHVEVETQKLFEDDIALLTYFKRLVRDLEEDGVIHRERDTLKKEFKELKQYLRGVPPRVEHADRHVIAFACQEGADIHTKDEGIVRALHIIQTSRSARRWHPYTRKILINHPRETPLLPHLMDSQIIS